MIDDSEAGLDASWPDPEYKPRSKEERSLVSTNGEGRWWRRIWKEQCFERVLFGDRCQGTLGHVGSHWSYNAEGAYCWLRNADDPVSAATHVAEDIAGGITPPSHKGWISPVAMVEHHYMRFYDDQEITDPTEIAFYEADGHRGDEGVTRPCNQEEIDELIAEGRLKPEPKGPKSE
jgi:hypothetical protein